MLDFNLIEPDNDLRSDGQVKQHTDLSRKTPIVISELLRSKLFDLKVEGPKNTLLSYEHTVWGLLNFFECYKDQHPEYKEEVKEFAARQRKERERALGKERWQQRKLRKQSGRRTSE